MSPYFIWTVLIGVFLMMRPASRQQYTMQEEQKRHIERGLVPGNWVRIIGGFYGTIVGVDGDVVTPATPLDDETLQSRWAITTIEEPPPGSASVHEESSSDVEQTGDSIQGFEQSTAEPQP